MNPIHILLVDDYRDALDMWAMYLRACGYEVATAGDGLEAVALAQASPPDLAILDLDLPGITGLEAARRLRAEPATAHVRLIAATGYSQTKMLDEARLAGFDAVLVKPCEPTRLVGEIERLLGSAAPRPLAE